MNQLNATNINCLSLVINRLTPLVARLLLTNFRWLIKLKLWVTRLYNISRIECYGNENSAIRNTIVPSELKDKLELSFTISYLSALC